MGADQQLDAVRGIADLTHHLDSGRPVPAGQLWPGSVRGPPLEPVHLHGVADTSTHLCLPADRAREICALGWGEPHGYAEHATEVMVY